MRKMLAVSLVTVAFAVFIGGANANHSWNGYHWARTANPFEIKLGDNVSGLWDGMLVTAASDWGQSGVLNTQQSGVLNTRIVAGGTRAKQCRPTSGRVEVCSANYGNTGWLGVAQIWISGGVHITQGTVKNNDYYFGNSTYQYNNTAEMQHVICQEIGHTFGLDHQSTDGSTLKTCMDYYHNTSASDDASTHPNQHDYDELATIYSHLDSITTIGASTGFLPDAVPSFAPANRVSESVYRTDLGGGRSLVTYVYWID